mgnify:FL=1
MLTDEQVKNVGRLAAVLALNTADHRESAHKDRNLVENDIDAEKSNIACAKAFGFYEIYQSKVNNVAPRLFYNLD